MARENGLQTDGEEEVGIIVTGEKALMIGHEGAARTLLTHGPVVEETIPVEIAQTDPIMLALAR